MSSSQVQCGLKKTSRDIVAVVKSHTVLPWLGAWGVTGSGHRWYILKSYAPDNIRAFYMRCWPVKVHIVTWKRCNLSEYNWAFHSKCMGQFRDKQNQSSHSLPFRGWKLSPSLRSGVSSPSTPSIHSNILSAYGATSSFDGIISDKELTVFEYFSLQRQRGMQAHRLPW